MFIIKIIKWLIILGIISCEAGILYYFGNKIIINFINITSANNYLFNSSLLDCIGISLFICLISFFIYSIIIFFAKKVSLLSRIIISTISFFIVFIWLSAFSGPGGTLFLDCFVIKNILVFAITAVSTPYFDKILNFTNQ